MIIREGLADPSKATPTTPARSLKLNNPLNHDLDPEVYAKWWPKIIPKRPDTALVLHTVGVQGLMPRGNEQLVTWLP